MDINLNKEKLNFVKSVLSTSLPHEETMEMIVPDALPDILRIVDTDATVFLRSKATDNGRASVSGVAAVTVIYCPDGGTGVRKMELEIPFTVAAAESNITVNSKITASVNVASADASMINPRKIIARVDLLVEIDCYNEADMMISSGVDDDNEAGIELLTDNCEIFTTTGVKEKTFVISDELSLPNSNPPIGEILKTRVNVSPDDTKIVGSKLILRGNTNISVLYNPAGGGDMVKVDFTSEFSQIIELDSAPGDSTFNINLMLTNAYFDADQSPHNPDGRAITTELHAVAQCVASEKRNVNYIADMYSTKYKLEQNIQNYTLDSKNQDKVNAVFHGVLETPAPVGRVIAINVHAGAAVLTTAGGTALRCPLNVNAMFVSDDGRVMSSMRQYDIEANAEIKEGSTCSAHAVCGREVYGVAVGNGIELRIPVDFMLTETTQRQIRTLAGLEYDEEAPLDHTRAPSLVVYRTARGDTLWQLAKKHNTTSKLILSANGLDNEENVAAGQLLIIPKKR